MLHVHSGRAGSFDQDIMAVFASGLRTLLELALTVTVSGPMLECMQASSSN
jgi:hypothetical protein